MSKIRLFGDTSGFTEIAAANAAGNATVTLPNSGTIVTNDSDGAVGVTSVKATNAHFSGTTRVTTGITTTATITTATITGGTSGATIQDASGGNSSTPSEVFEGRAKAWVNFNGESTVAIRDSFNVSSITDNGTGSYTVNIDTDMSNVNYCVVVASGYGSNTQIQTSQNSQLFGYTTRTAGSFQIRHGNTEGNSNSDADDVHAVVFGD
mgnify:FL=1|tara:strand:+ start:653 stop:1276 length:624 start_codon:yes stop_codon:yes gene_type:complete